MARPLAQKPDPKAVVEARAFISAMVIIACGAGWIRFQHTVPDINYALDCWFYAVLLFNSYYSILCFSSIDWRDSIQHILNGLLVILYTGIALVLPSPLLFSALMCVLFMVASCKYAAMLGKTSHNDLLQRKVRVNVTAVFMCLVAFIGILLGFELPTLIIWNIIYTLAQPYLFIIKPLYRIPAV